MLISMTGFGSDTFSNDFFTLETEIKSFNSRFLDLSVRLPKEIYKHEFAIRDLIKNKVARGKVSLSINLTYNNISDKSVSIDSEALKNTLALLKQVNEIAENRGYIELNQILLLKDLFITDKKNELDIDLEIITKSVNSALNNFFEMKKAEGQELKKDLEFRIDNILTQLTKIEDLSKDSTIEYFEKFKERAKKLTEDFTEDKDRFLQELAILSEKHDITEECIRLKSHIKIFNETIKNNSDAGRKLNFISQEMNREVNTINSKTISSEISHAGIVMKEELEKIREQIQNIE
ncbi:MAG: YicC family protein [Ignavibacteriales bacterium]|nr:YicC family protein [Ignavibacteriota bacterium]MCB9248177.1 YicC family protein [Ignavibacteriales bacterium]